MQTSRLTAIILVLSYVLPSLSASLRSKSRAGVRRELPSWELNPWAEDGFGYTPPDKVQGNDTFSVIVWGATLGTRDDAQRNEGLLCILRYGAAGTSWDDKPRGTGRVSTTSTPGARSPTWNLGALVTGDARTEISVRVFADEPARASPESHGQRLPGKKRLLGEISVGIDTLRKASSSSIDGKALFDLPGGGHVQMTGVRGGVAPNFALAENGISPSSNYELAAPIAGQQAVRVEDLTAAGPLIPGAAPLPLALQGVWWIVGQGSGSALMSFGGPNNDGNGCSLGYITGQNNTYRIRAEGERVFATSDPSGLDKIAEVGDKVYNFEFDSAARPTFGRVHLTFENINIKGKAKWAEHALSSEIHLLPRGDPEYPGSLVWVRNTTVFGANLVADSKLIQIMDGAGEKIEPAWSKFVATEKDPENRKFPGWMFYKSISPVTSPWAVAVTEEMQDTVRIHLILILVGLLVFISCCLAVGAYGCVRLYRWLRFLEAWHQEKRKRLVKQSYWIH